jgi:formate dehydrogenase accessory protein FdhD
MCPIIVKTKVHRINLVERSLKVVDDEVAVEAAVRVIINDKPVATLFCLPERLKELGVGWLLSQGILTSINEIRGIQVSGSRVKIKCTDSAETRMAMVRITGHVDSSCGSTSEDFTLLMDRIEKPFVSSDYRIDAGKLYRLVGLLNKNAELFRKTGGTHSAVLFNRDRVVAFAEDVGRHNALDKVIGEAALERIDFSQSIIASSGRQPANMVLKAARVGIPVIASVAAPLSSGIDAAKKTGVTLVCFVRDHRMNVYSHPERILVQTCSTRQGSESNEDGR